ncbi:hypothetical protein SprV_0100155800 [Sparganum proliferum]
MSIRKHKRDRFQTEIKSQIKIIEEEKKRYREKYYEALRFKADFEKIDADNTYSRLEVEKALNLYSLKNCEFKRARADYIVALEQFNLNRGYHYNHTLKQWGEAGQEMEVYRIKKTQELLCVLAERLRVTIDRMTSVCSDLEATAARIDAEKDSRALIERLRTGNLPPEDEPFEDLIIEDPPVINLESYGESMKRQLSIGNLPNSVVNTDDPEAVAKSHSTPDTLTPSTDAVVIATRENPSRNKYGTKGRRMSSLSTVVGSGAAARRLSASSLALGNSQVNGNGQSIMRKLFSRRSKSRDRSKRSTCLSSSPEDVQLGRSKSIKEPSMSGDEQIELHSDGPEKPDEKQYLFDNSDISDRTFDSTENLIDSAWDGNNQNSAPPRISVTHQSPVTLPSEMDPSLTRHSQQTPIYSTAGAPHDGEMVGSVPLSNDPEPARLANSDSQCSVQAEQELSSSGFQRPARPPPPTQTVFNKNSNTYQRVMASDNRTHDRERSARFQPSSMTAPMSVKPRTGVVYSGPVPSLRSNRNSTEGTPHQQPKSDVSPVNQRTVRPQQQSRHGVHQPKRHPVDRTGIPTSNSSQDLQSEGADQEMVVVGTCTALYDFTSEQFGTSFLSFKQGDEFDLLASRGQFPNSLDIEGWYYAEKTKPAHSNPKFGFIPASFVQVDIFTEAVPLSRTSSELYRAHLSGTVTSNNDHSKQHDVFVSRQHKNYQNMALGQATEL